MEAVSGRHMQLIAELSGETNPPDNAVGNASDAAATNLHEAEGLVTKIDPIYEFGKQLSTALAGHVDAGVCGRHRDNVDLPVWMLCLQPILDPVPDPSRPRAGGCHEVAVLPQSSCYAVIKDHTLISAHDAITHRSDRQGIPGVRVEKVQKLDHISAVQL